MTDLLKQIDKLQDEINKQRPLDENKVKQIKEYYRIGLTYTSNAIEGNTLTETETKIVLEEGITIGGKRLIEHLEAIGHSDAYDFLYACAQKKEVAEEDIRHMHRLFYYRIDEESAGVYRKMQVYITGSKYPVPSPNSISVLMEQSIANFTQMRGTKHPVEFAALAHKEFVFIHPFIDGNGRVARLLMNLILLQHGYNIAIIPPIVRNEYIQTLEKAHIDDSDFIQFIARMVKETQKDYLRLFGQ